MLRSPYLLVLAIALGGCSLTPDYQRPPLPVAAQFPQSDVTTRDPAAAGAHWRDVFHDPLLRQLITTALIHNRDLRVAALNVEGAHAQLRIRRGDLLPKASADTRSQRQYLPRGMTGTGDGVINQTHTATLGINAYELDLFGRLRSLSDQALLTYLATEQAQRSVQLALVSSVASAYLTWRADLELLDVARQTLATEQESLRLTRGQRRAGTVSALQQIQAQTSVDTARAAVARYQRQLAQDVNQLTVLIGVALDGQLPALPLAAAQIAELPAGLPSDLLQRRPDILDAEFQLRAANANIGAARAAFFPSISLTATAGSSSRELSGLFEKGSGSWLFRPQLSLPLFNAGSLRASLEVAQVQRAIKVQRYQQVIQVAFQEVADGLAARARYGRQLEAQRALVQSTERYHALARNRYRAGVDSSLVYLDAQRSLFAARQELISGRLAQLLAEVDLHAALGGGWSSTVGPCSDCSGRTAAMR